MGGLLTHQCTAGFDVADAIALLRLDDLYVEVFEVKDVKVSRLLVPALSSTESSSKDLWRLVRKQGVVLCRLCEGSTCPDV